MAAASAAVRASRPSLCKLQRPLAALLLHPKLARSDHACVRSLPAIKPAACCHSGLPSFAGSGRTLHHSCTGQRLSDPPGEAGAPAEGGEPATRPPVALLAAALQGLAPSGAAAIHQAAGRPSSGFTDAAARPPERRAPAAAAAALQASCDQQWAGTRCPGSASLSRPRRRRSAAPAPRPRCGGGAGPSSHGHGRAGTPLTPSLTSPGHAAPRPPWAGMPPVRRPLGPLPLPTPAARRPAAVAQKARDECTATYGPEDPKCAPLIEAHKVCLRKEGFNVSAG